MQSFERFLERDRQKRKEIEKKNRDLFLKLEAVLQVAEVKHPVFATNFNEAVMRVVEELGEIAQARNKQQGVVRENEEVWDLLCVVWRLAREDWKEYAVD